MTTINGIWKPKKKKCTIYSNGNEQSEVTDQHIVNL